MKVLATIIIIAFAGIALMGVFSMSHDMDHVMESNCFASAIDGVVCAKGLVSSIAHHTAVHQTFSNGITASSLFLLSMLLALAFVFSVVLVKTSESYNIGRLTSYERFRFKSSKYLSNKNKISWLSLLENSPSFVMAVQ